MNEITHEGQQPAEILTNETLNQLNDSIYQTNYLREHNYPKAVQEFGVLIQRILDQGAKGIDFETISKVWANYAWSQYREDVSTGLVDSRSYGSAQIGLDLLPGPPGYHETRSRLLGVAGLCQKYIVKEQDEPAEPFLRSSLEEAQRSANPSRIGEATNEFGILYFSLARDERDAERKRNYYQEAIPIFEEAAKIHEEVGTTTPNAGHPYNNLIECYTGISRYEDAIEAADRALEKYNDDRSPHSFSARFRKSLALRGLGRQTMDRSYFEQALAIYEQHKILRTEDAEKIIPEESEGQRAQRQSQITRLMANEERNIEATRQEMQAVFGPQS